MSLKQLFLIVAFLCAILALSHYEFHRQPPPPRQTPGTPNLPLTAVAENLNALWRSIEQSPSYDPSDPELDSLRQEIAQWIEQSDDSEDARRRANLLTTRLLEAIARGPREEPRGTR